MIKINIITNNGIEYDNEGYPLYYSRRYLNLRNIFKIGIEYYNLGEKRIYITAIRIKNGYKKPKISKEYIEFVAEEMKNFMLKNCLTN